MQSTALHITALGHAGIAVRDLQASKAFYAGVLGMRAVPTGEGRKLRFQVRASSSWFARCRTVRIGI
jgi:catechol 2,3-dioxygenase-like lactoylglutathione lyase family enzyme